MVECKNWRKSRQDGAKELSAMLLGMLHVSIETITCTVRDVDNAHYGELSGNSR